MIDTDELTEAILEYLTQERATSWMEDFHEDLWDDTDQKSRSPEFRTRQKIPKFVQNILETVIERDWHPEPPNGVDVPRQELKEFYQGEVAKPTWTLDSIVENYADEFDVNTGWARVNVRDDLHELMMYARVRGYRDGGYTKQPLGDKQFKWSGPVDDNNTEACIWIREQARGGVSIDQLGTYIKEAKRRFVDDPPDHPFRPHDGCRHQMKEIT